MAADSVIGRAVLEITVDDKQYTLALDQISKASRKTAGDVNKLFNFEVLKSAGNIFMSFAGKAVDALTVVGSEVVDLAAQGSQVSAMSGAFGALTSSVGMTADQMLGTLRPATSGLINDFDLMAASNKAILLGLPVSAESMGTMAQAATVLGRAMGQDAKKSLDDLTTALGRGSPLILDNLGLTVKVGEANEAYAKSLNKSATELTEEEKKMAFYTAAMAAAEQKVKDLGGVQKTLGDHIQTARVAWENFRNGLAQAIATSGPLNAALQQVGIELSKAFGPNQGMLIEAIVGIIEKVVFGMAVFVGVTADGVQLAINVWTAYRTAIQGVATFFWQTVATMATKLAELAEKASALPVVGEKFAGLATSLQTVADYSERAATNSKALSDSYTQAGTTYANAAGAVSDAAARVAQAMINAEGATVRAKTAQTDLNKKLEDPAPVTGALASDRAISDSRRKLEADLAALGTSGLQQKLAVIDAEFNDAVAKITALKDIRTQEATDQIALATQVKDQKTALAIAEGDETKLRTQTLQQELLLMQQTGIQQELMALEFKKQAELAAIETLRITNITAYNEQAALIGAKYAEMTAAAQGHYGTVQAAAAAAGFKTRAEQERTAANAQATYERMKASGLYTESELTAARQKATDAQVAVNDKKTEALKIADSSWANASVELLSMMGGKFKAAAIAAVIISTAQAVMKTWGNLGFPAAIPGTVVAVAAGAMQIAKIRSQSTGFKEGTPGLDYSNFGTATTTHLHGQEAVIPRGKGHMLAGEIAGSMPDNSALLERIAGGIESLPLIMKRAVRDGLLLANG